MEQAFKFDQRLMAQAKGLVWEESQEDENQLSPTVLESVARQPSQAAESLSDPVEPKITRTAMSVLRSVIRRLSQDDQGPSTNTADPTQRKSRSATKISPGLSSKAVASKPKFGVPKSLLKRKTSRSKSPKKKCTRVQDDGADYGANADAENSLEDDEEKKGTLTAQSIVQQVGQVSVASLICSFHSF